MPRKFRILIYCVVGLTIPVLSQLIYGGPLWEPLSFVGLVLVIAVGYEVWSARNKN